jgi:twitching motility protein PilT
LLSAIVRADGDALVMHVGERPYVVVGTQTINISTNGLSLDQMIGMLSQLVPAESQGQLDEFGAVECRIPYPGNDDRFSVVAARGGDDVWIEIRRRRAQPAGHAPAAEPPPVAVAAPVVAEPVSEPVPEPIQQPAPAPMPEPVAHAAPEPVLHPEPIVPIPEAPAAVPEPVAIVEPIAVPEPQVIPEAVPETVPETIPETVVEPAAAIAEPEPEPAPVVQSVPEPVVDAPLTRTVRIEVPPRAPAAASRPSSSTTDIDRLLRAAASRGASQLFLTSESRPWLRIEGDLRQLDSEPLWSRADVERTILEIVPESAQESVGSGEATEWIADFDEVGRIRCSTFVDHRGPGLLLRMIATRAATAEQLGLSREVQALATEAQGLVLVAGSRSSGRSTLISALIDLANRQRAEYVITLERQIRFIHDNKSALVSQREIRGGAEESVTAVRAALRESPDVLVVDDVVSSDMVPLLLSAASDGVLVVVSMTAQSTSDAIVRFIDLAPAETRKGVQSQLAESFRGAVAQLLLKKPSGGFTAVRELMLATAPVAHAIAEGQMSQLPLVFENGRQDGMVSFTEPLVELVRAGTIDVRDAYRKTPERDRLVERLKHHGIDTSAVERLS